GAGPSLVIDPGPDDPSHVTAVAKQASHVQAILLTHHHPDHAPGAPRLSDMTGAPILALRPEPGEARLRDGEGVEAGGGGGRAARSCRSRDTSWWSRATRTSLPGSPRRPRDRAWRTCSSWNGKAGRLGWAPAPRSASPPPFLARASGAADPLPQVRRSAIDAG